MNAYDFVHLAFHALGDQIKGKTKLQKVMYFLGVLTDSLDDLGYRPHYYGPYSSEVAGAVDRLRALGFVDQAVASAGTFDNAGFEVARYDFQLSESGKKLAETKAKRNPTEWAELQNAARMLAKAKDDDYVKLSVAAKVHLMLGEKKGTAKLRELVSIAGKFGWSVTPEQVKEAAELLESVGLVKLAATK